MKKVGADAMRPLVAVIEDNEMNCKLFKDIMDEEGFDSIIMRDGKGAFEMIKKKRPDAIVMDIMLPSISGIELAKMLKSDKSLRHIPIIAVTAYATEYDRGKILEAGCDEYIAKPFSLEHFVSTLLRLLPRDCC